MHAIPLEIILQEISIRKSLEFIQMQRIFQVAHCIRNRLHMNTVSGVMIITAVSVLAM